MAIAIQSVKNNVVRVYHPSLEGNPRTYLTTAVAATGTTLTVQDNTGFANTQYIVVGEPGVDKTEIVKINGAVTRGTSITSTACVFAHPIGTPVRLIYGNQLVIKSSATETGTYSTLTTIDIQIDNVASEYDDTAGTTSVWYKVALYNAGLAAEVEESYPIQALGYNYGTLGYMIDECITRTKDDKKNWESWKTLINLGQREAENQRKYWSFAKGYNYEDQSVSGVDAYDLPSDIRGKDHSYIIGVTYNNTDRLEYVDVNHMVTARSLDKRTELSAAIALVDTTVSVVDASGLSDSGNIVISGDTIAYTGKSTNTLTGVTGIDATHDVGDVVFQDSSLADPTYYTIMDGHMVVNPCPVTDDEYLSFYYFFRLPELTDEDQETLYPNPETIVVRAMAEKYRMDRDADNEARMIDMFKSSSKRDIDQNSVGERIYLRGNGRSDARYYH